MGSRALVLALALAPAALPAQPARPAAFEWGKVPGTQRIVPVHGGLEAAGIPVRAWEVISSAKPEELLAHFAGSFERAGLYVPPPAHQARVRRAFQLSGLDVERLIAYSALLRSNNDGTTTVILGEANVGAARTVDAWAIAPLFPGAAEVITANVEAARMVGYSTHASEEELAAFYRETLGAAGYQEVERNVFRRAHEELRVFSKPRASGRQVVVMVRGGVQEEAPLDPP